MTDVAVSERQDPQTNPGLTANRPGPSRSNESPLLAASCRSLNATTNENQGHSIVEEGLRLLEQPGPKTEVVQAIADARDKQRDAQEQSA